MDILLIEDGCAALDRKVYSHQGDPLPLVFKSESQEVL